MNKFICAITIYFVLFSISWANSNSVVRIEAKYQDGSNGVFSGVIIHSTESKAAILTCAHGFSDVAAYTYVFVPGESQKYLAKGLWKEHDNDLAALEIETDKELPASTLSTQNTVAGMPIYQIGYPMGAWKQTKRTGRVQTVSKYTSMKNNPVHTTTFKVQSGDSGSPVFSNANEVIGIVSASRDVCYFTPVSAIQSIPQADWRYGCSNGQCPPQGGTRQLRVQSKPP